MAIGSIPSTTSTGTTSSSGIASTNNSGLGTISSLGVGSGLDLQGMLDQLRAADEQPINQKQDQITNLNAQLTEFNAVQKKLLDFQSIAQDLSLQSTYIGRTATSSDDSVVGVSAEDGATVQDVSVQVDRLATNSTWQSSTGMSSADAVLTNTDTAVGFTVGSTAFSVDVPASTTLSGLVGLINNDSSNPGVTASVINDGSGTNAYHLVLKANQTGENYRISNINNLVMTEVQGNGGASLNAQLEVDGITYTRQQNSINDVLNGITMTLNKGGGSTSEVTVMADDSGLTKKITDLVNAYNGLVQEISSHSGYDQDTKVFGPLANTTVTDLPYQMENLMTATVNAGNGSVKTLFDLGMKFNEDGTISIDNNTLSAAISSDPEGVQSFFLGDSNAGVTGFADQLNNYLLQITGSTGQVQAEENSAKSKIDDLNQQIQDDTARLNKKYDNLTQQFIQLDQYMNQMTNMSSYLTSQFNSLSKMWGTSNSNSNG
ncbi:MAG: flagellar filament capping protein FliD [Desulfobacteraceae bacterium]|nr:flagellar filament capping protein FliD [Desulfobacteraceae bacterium]